LAKISKPSDNVRHPRAGEGPASLRNKRAAESPRSRG
jgi:hypothetical protein